MIAAFTCIRGSGTEAPAQLPVGLAPIVTVIATFLLAFGRADFLPPVLAAWTGNIVFAGVGTVLLPKGRT